MNGARLESPIVSRFQLIAELAQGGMATVYLAALRGAAGFQKLVVVKILRDDVVSDDADTCSMFLNEARLTGRMQHPNIAQTLEVGQADGRVFLVMEYLEGQCLHAVVARARQSPSGWSLAMHLRVLTEALAGLHYAHELCDYDGRPLGIVHRDATPHNLFVTYDGSVKLVDFGVAKAIVSDVRTRLGVLKGKISYMAPEQAAGGTVDRRVDVFAAGVMLFEALTGRRMWRGYTEIEIFRDLARLKIPDIHASAPHVPRELRDICARALAPAPEDRYATAADLQGEIEKWLNQTGDRVSPKELGQVVSDLFPRERQEVRTAVDNHMRGAPVPASLAAPASMSASSQSTVTGTRDEPVPAIAATASRTHGKASRFSARTAIATCGTLSVGAALAIAISRAWAPSAGTVSAGLRQQALALQGPIHSGTGEARRSESGPRGATESPEDNTPPPPPSPTALAPVLVSPPVGSSLKDADFRSVKAMASDADATRRSSVSRSRQPAPKAIEGEPRAGRGTDPDRSADPAALAATAPSQTRASQRPGRREKTSSNPDALPSPPPVATETARFGDGLPSESAPRPPRPIDTSNPFTQ